MVGRAEPGAVDRKDQRAPHGTLHEVLLILHTKSAHLYESEREPMRSVVAHRRSGALERHSLLNAKRMLRREGVDSEPNEEGASRRRVDDE